MSQKRLLVFCLMIFLVAPAACRGQKKEATPPASVTATAPAPVPPPATSPAPTKTEAAPASEEEAKVNQWLEGMQSVLPGIFCKDKSYFRECFKVTEQECEKEAIRVTRVCIESKKSDIKANLVKDGGKKWGEKIGECAGETYELSLKDKRISNDKCNDAKNWM